MEIFVADYIRQLTYSERTALDIGSCRGAFSLFMQDKFAKIYALEPNPTNFKVLSERTKEYPNIEPVQLAIGRDNNGTYMACNPYNDGAHSISRRVYEDTEARTKYGFDEAILMQVKTMTLNDFTKDKDVAFAKFDVEAAEDFIFEEDIAGEFLSREDLNIMLEVHNFVDREKLFSIFKNHGFKPYGIGMSFNAQMQIAPHAVPVNYFEPDNHYLLHK